MIFDFINFFEKENEGQRLLSGSMVIALQSAVLWLFSSQLWHHMLEDLEFLEDLPTLLITDFLFSTGSEEAFGPLVRLIFSKFSKRFK
jgi:hypothetical protein